MKSTASLRRIDLLFLGIDNVRFRQKILPGDTIQIKAALPSERKEKAIVACSAEIYNRSEVAATGNVTPSHVLSWTKIVLEE